MLSFRPKPLEEVLPKYTYQPLPTATSIRLIEVRPKSSSILGSKTVRLSLITVPLRKAPIFDALSYTWGNPMSKFSRKNDEAYESKKEFVEIDGRRLEVGLNLVDALHMLQTVNLKAAKQSQAKYIWIDAICINQEDNDEKAAQVSIMGDIYKEATNVIVWIGAQDEFTDDAMTTIRRIAKIDPQRYAEVQPSDFFQQQVVLFRLGVWRSLSYTHWLGLTVFLNRPWFSRIWIVQEVILSRNAIVVCGSEVFQWDLLARTLSFLAATTWHTYISTATMKTFPEVMAKPGAYRKLLEQEESVGIGMSAVYLTTTRTGILQSGNLALFRYLIQVHRCCHATNPRDKIYALLSLSRRDRPPFTTHGQEIVPSYHLTPKELYTRIARIMLLSYGDLRFLPQVEDPEWRVLDGLPSWVPDYTVVLAPDPLEVRGDCKWNACGNLKWTPDEGALSSPLLRVSGILVDTLAEINLVSAWTVDHSMEMTNYMLNLFHLVGQVTETQTGNLTGSPPSRVEVFWRTWLGDAYLKQHPAPSELGSVFLERIAWMVGFTFIGEEITPTDGPEPRWELLLQSIRRVLETEPRGSACSLERFDDILPVILEDAMAKKHTEMEWSTRFRQFDIEVDYMAKSRRYFITEGGRLGLGTRSLGVGDEVWVLGGAETPVLLRKNADGQYRLIGECYVHGIMHGEATDLGHKVVEVYLC